MKRVLSVVVIVGGVGLFVLGATGGNPLPGQFGNYSHWSQTNQILMAVGAMLVCGGALARRG